MITAATATDVCFVHVLDDSDRSLTLAGATPPFDSEVGKIRLPLGSGISGWVASHREPVVISHDKESDPRYMPFQSLRGSDFTSMVSVPMETDPGGLVGVLNVHTVEQREFTPGDVELLLVIGRLIAGAMHQARLHRQLVVRERAHENFVEQVIEAQELERRRLAGDIHDGISQRLITLSYRLDAASRAAVTDPTAMAEQLGMARELVDLTLQEARAAIGGLRPPVLDDLGLAGGLASLARSIGQIDVKVDVTDTRLPDHIEIALYRIAQECLQNVVKHAGASTAQLTFAVDAGDSGNNARLEIVDDGVGFDTFEHPLGSDEMGGYGLLSMAERAEIVGGRLNIRSRPGFGHGGDGDDPAAERRGLGSPFSASRRKSPVFHGVSGTFASARERNVARLEVAGVATQRFDRCRQGPRFVVGDADVGEDVVVQCHGRVLNRGAAEIGDLHQRGAAVGGVRQPCHQAVCLQPPDCVGDAGDVHLQPVGRLGDRQRAVAAERQQPQQLVAGEAEVIGPQCRLHAGQQDLVGPHHRCDRDHPVRDVTPAGALPVGTREGDRISRARLGRRF